MKLSKILSEMKVEKPKSNYDYFLKMLTSKSPKSDNFIIADLISDDDYNEWFNLNIGGHPDDIDSLELSSEEKELILLAKLFFNWKEKNIIFIAEFYTDDPDEEHKLPPVSFKRIFTYSMGYKDIVILTAF